MIRKVKYNDIDFKKYNHCLENSEQKNWYAKKEVLDHLSGNWECLVYGDYQAIMPVHLKKKLGFTFVHMPLFCQQFGVFSERDNPSVNSEFLKFLKNNYKVFLYCFNDKNQFNTELEKRKNFIIPVSDYETLKRKKYFKGRKSTVKWSQHLTYKEIPLDENSFIFIEKKFKGLSKPSDFHVFKNYINFLNDRQLLKLCGVFFESQMINLAVVIADREQYSLLALINDDDFKDENGPSFLIDKILSKYIHEKSFNFMGSNIRGIQVFFKSFGGELCEYSFTESKILKKFS
ncbi:hypothetical protein [Chryseobacterium wangxinyae]|uniref:hypothetical protein n=1 Tax=Chryseobacterium sp. CY353 TaxID=2997334 RepID=UPI00226F0AFC|nr:hypothetical protein [Chryseobacterium sp. CY353]MCY0968475.1 hypothetical protein [Chryseobacterium sp. CY353]